MAYNGGLSLSWSDVLGMLPCAVLAARLASYGDLTMRGARDVRMHPSLVDCLFSSPTSRYFYSAFPWVIVSSLCTLETLPSDFSARSSSVLDVC